MTIIRYSRSMMGSGRMGGSMAMASCSGPMYHVRTKRSGCMMCIEGSSSMGRSRSLGWRWIKPVTGFTELMIKVRNI